MLKSTQLAPNETPISWAGSINIPNWSVNCSQALTGRIIAKLMLVSDQFSRDEGGGTVRKRFLHLDLDSSNIGVGTLSKNDPAEKGIFLTKVEYWAWLTLPEAAGNLNSPHPDLMIQSESPESVNGTGTVSSTIGYSISGSAGFFGDTPTGGVSGGVNISTSYSHQIQDFTFSQLSDAKIMHHTLVMTCLGDGTPYTDPSSMVNSWQDPFYGAQLRPLPTIAASSCPIPGQAVWMNTSDAGLVPTIVLNLLFSATFAYVVAENNGFTIPNAWATETFSQAIAITVDFTQSDS